MGNNGQTQTLLLFDGIPNKTIMLQFNTLLFCSSNKDLDLDADIFRDAL